jgi:hypothetical protein
LLMRQSSDANCCSDVHPPPCLSLQNGVLPGLYFALRTASQLPRDSEQFAIHIDERYVWTRMRDDPDEKRPSVTNLDAHA